MGIKVKDIKYAMNKIAPEVLKEDFDNVGLMVGDEEQEVSKILLALDCTKKVIEEAKDNGCDMIITHHPLIFRKPNKIIKNDLLGSKIIELIKNDISLYSSHTNLDSVENGINDTIVKMLGFTSCEIIEESRINGFNNAGLGRIVRLEKETNIKEIISLIKKNLNINNLRVVEGVNTVKTLAIINGSGQDFISEAVKLGSDCIITGDTTYHFASDYKELGVNIIDAGHFNTEWLVFLETMKTLKENFKNIEFIDSKVSNDPYTFF
ncbi:Nif3-like dinuclear metal center hexameric protein [Clostridium sardiniense]|uniref:Nif3-like dinuclear metal center hexameric protein n=1 Tax=Clostridium sardiniense TaxID=29369 RepID=UPI003C5B4893|nr:dinuclear metal center YbgI/SA1388 family protein [Clostridium sardiniense]